VIITRYFLNIVTNIARIWDRKGIYRVLVGKTGERDKLEDPGVDGRIILRCIFNKWYVSVRTGSMLLRIGPALVNVVMNIQVP